MKSKVRNYRGYTFYFSAFILFSIFMIKFHDERDLKHQEYWKEMNRKMIRKILKFTASDIYHYISYEAFAQGDPRKIWHDSLTIDADKKRIGLGENGTPVYIRNQTLNELKWKLFEKFKYNALVSDLISVNRSIPDVRPIKCHKRKYLNNLPKVSVIITYRNECLTVLLRTLHSLVNRTPQVLLKEIIIVDDNSDREMVTVKVKKYIKENFPELVKFVYLSKRNGRPRARSIGANAATGEVLVFVEGRTEFNYNWLPPLIEPIAINDRIVTTPIIDTIGKYNFVYQRKMPENTRGGFNWKLEYQDMILTLRQTADKTLPFKTPIMMSEIYAISRDFYWELGGEDQELNDWGGEQFEMSFKIWMCDGIILNVPCSHVGHLFMEPAKYETLEIKSLKAKNKKRIAEIWMDDYKQYIYDKEPELYSNLNIGDLSVWHQLRKNLKCQSFEWFLNTVAPDIVKTYPPVPPSDFASGVIQSIAYPEYCLDSMNGLSNYNVEISYCSNNRTHPYEGQNWLLGWRQDLKTIGENLCMDVSDFPPNAKVDLDYCHYNGGNQYWYYDVEMQWLVHFEQGSSCLEVIRQGEQLKVVTNPCEETNPNMKWTFSYINNEVISKMKYM